MGQRGDARAGRRGGGCRPRSAAVCRWRTRGSGVPRPMWGQSWKGSPVTTWLSSSGTRRCRWPSRSRWMTCRDCLRDSTRPARRSLAGCGETARCVRRRRPRSVGSRPPRLRPGSTAGGVGWGRTAGRTLRRPRRVVRARGSRVHEAGMSCSSPVRTGAVWDGWGGGNPPGTKSCAYLRTSMMCVVSLLLAGGGRGVAGTGGLPLLPQTVLRPGHSSGGHGAGHGRPGAAGLRPGSGTGRRQVVAPP